MSIKVEKINKIFIKKMAISLLAQLLILCVLIIFIRNYIKDSQVNSISNNLLIKDLYSLEKIAQYKLLQSNYALDLELHNLSEEKKLDNIKFFKEIPRLQCDILNLKKFKLCKIGDEYIGISMVSINHKVLGYIVARKKYDFVASSALTYDLLLILLSIIGIFVINVGLLFFPLKEKIEKNTGFLLDFLSGKDHENVSQAIISIEEYQTIARQFIDERNKITVLQAEKFYYEARKKIAEQVAHDIRSPLVAISTAVSDISAIPENQRVMVKNAATRINEIANNLLLSSKGALIDEQKICSNDFLLSESILIIVESIIIEKTYEYFNQKSIKFSVENNSHCCFATIHLASFKRVLSNLINNSIEASTAQGVIDIRLRCLNGKIHITIIDNGCGIPPYILPKIMEQGFSFGKESGAGFGLYHAKQQIDLLNGKLLIESEVDVGTQVTIVLPQCKPPVWFCDKLAIQYGANIIILDDDPSIHDAWNQRLSHMPNLNITHYKSIAEFLIVANEPQSCDALYLIDYEFLLDDKNGVDVIEQLNIQQHSILVTSAFEDQALRTRCLTLGIKIIPKPYVPYIPISVAHNPHSHTNIILIDDNKLVRMTWQFAAKKAGCDLKIYSSFESFVSEIDRHDKSTAIYLDSDLGNGIKGEECAYRLFQQGFTNIHITTGYCVEKYLSFSWIKTVIGKTPPFYIVK